MNPKCLFVLVLCFLSLGLVGCKTDSLLMENVEVEFPLGRNMWIPAGCIGSPTSEIEIRKGLYYLDIDLDYPLGKMGKFGKGFDLRFTTATEFGQILDRYTQKNKMNKKTGVVSSQVQIDEDLIIPRHGAGCFDIRSRGRAFDEGMMMRFQWQLAL